MRDVTIIFPIRGNKIILGRKKRGFGKDKMNGFGGKVSEGEGVGEAAIRELREEAGITTKEENLDKVGVIEFYFPPEKAEKWNQRAHIYFMYEWEGEPKESEEMTIEEYDLDKIPLEKMWDTDRHWLPEIVAGKKIKAIFEFADDLETTKNYQINEVERF